MINIATASGLVEPVLKGWMRDLAWKDPTQEWDTEKAITRWKDGEERGGSKLDRILMNEKCTRIVCKYQLTYAPEAENREGKKVDVECQSGRTPALLEEDLFTH